MVKDIFTLDILKYLVSEDGQAALELARGLDAGKPSDVARLRRVCSLEQSRAVLELVELRERAAGKFSRAGEMFFDRVGYEQASGEVVAEYKAERVKLFGADERILDLCCGIGGDTIALAGAGQVAGIDQSAVRVRMADLNLRAYGRRENAQLVCGDLNDMKLEGGFFHLDPDQRAGRTRRTFSIEDLQPSREFIDRLIREVPDGVIKLSPGTEYSQLPWEGEIELVSHKGQCRQLLVWTGKPAGVKLRATTLPSGCAITDEMPVAFNVSGIQGYLYDPDPTITRLRLLGQLAAEMALNFLSPGQIVLTSDTPVLHPMARAFRVEEVMPYHEDKVKKYFQQRGDEFGPVTVKPRGVQVKVDQLSKLYSGKSGPEKTLFLLRLDKRIMAVITTAEGRE